MHKLQNILKQFKVFCSINGLDFILKKHIFLILILLLLVTIIASLGIGAMAISPKELLLIFGEKLGWITSGGVDETKVNVLWYIRLPRVIFALVIGATLAIAGVGMQGLFRNPLADVGLIGIGSGASLTAVFMIVLGTTFFANFQSWVGQYALNVVTFLGALLTMLLVYRISKQGNKTSISIMLLTGVAINAIAGALTGFITLAADEQQLRSLTFWSMGSLGGANWISILGLLPFCLVSIIGLPFFGKSLNVLALGETDANSLGIHVEKTKNLVMVLAAVGVGACVAVSGVIGFLGLVVPHVFRILLGPEHKRLMLTSILGGAILLCFSDLLSRTIASPIEIPIGIITSITGGPFFLYLILKEKKKQLI